MLVLRPYRLIGSRKSRVSKAACGDANEARQPSRLPKDVRSAAPTESKEDGEPARGRSFERRGVAGQDVDVVTLEEDRDAEGAASSPLTIGAMAHGDLPRDANAANLEVTAMAASDPFFHRVFHAQERNSCNVRRARCRPGLSGARASARG